MPIQILSGDLDYQGVCLVETGFRGFHHCGEMRLEEDYHFDDRDAQVLISAGSPGEPFLGCSSNRGGGAWGADVRTASGSSKGQS